MDDRELIVTRRIEAPRELVFAAFTDARHIAEWWGPRGFRNTIHERNVRPGGVWRYMMHGPDGTDYPNRVKYLEIQAPERLVYQHDSDKDDDPNGFHVTISLEPAGTGTQVTLRLLCATAEQAENFKKFGAIDGGTQNLTRLDEFLTLQAPGAFSITRRFTAPRELVYQALTEPEHLLEWWGPVGCTLPKCTVDLRPGGEFRYCMLLPNGDEWWGKWMYRDVMPNERLVYVLSFCDEDGNVIRHPVSDEWPLEMLSSITFEDDDERTRVTLRCVPIGETPAERKTFVAGHANMQRGFTGTWDNLEAYLDELQKEEQE